MGQLLPSSLAYLVGGLQSGQRPPGSTVSNSSGGGGNLGIGTSGSDGV